MFKKLLGLIVCACTCFMAMNFPVGSALAQTGANENEVQTVNSEAFEQVGVSEDQLTFYHSSADNMRVENGNLVSTADGEQKAMVKESVFSSQVMEIEFTVAPETVSGAINHGVYFHAKDLKDAYQKIHALNLQVVRGEGEGYYQIFLRSYLNNYVRDEQKTLKQIYAGGPIAVKLIVDEEEINVYLDDSNVPSMTKKRHNTTQSGTQIGFRANGAAGTISDIRISSVAVKPEVPTVKVLMVGNSFSVDAMAYVHEIARADGINFVAGVLYYGGCTLEQHNDFIFNRKNVYTYYKNGITDEPDVTFWDVIADEDWDVVTFQNPSTVAGLYDSWFPYIPRFLSMMETLYPEIEVGLHMTWVSPWFMEGQNNRKLANYNDSTDLAHSMNVSTHKRIIQEHGISFVIPSGVSMMNMHGTPVCDSTKMATSFCRDDTCHANEKGRYMIACTVYETITGHKVTGNTYAPYGATYGSDPGATAYEREIIHGVVDAVFQTGEYEPLNWFGKTDELSHLTVSAPITRYKAGEYFQYNCLTVNAHYVDGRTEEVKLYTIDIRRRLTKEDKEITVSYRGKQVKIPIVVV